MNLEKLFSGMLTRRPSGASPALQADESARRCGASERAHRARQATLETLENRLVLSTMVPTLTDLAIVDAGGHVVRELTPSGAAPSPGLQTGGDEVRAIFSLPADYHGPAIKVGVADYSSATYLNPNPASTPGVTKAWLDQQIYIGSTTATLDSTHRTATLYLPLFHSDSDDGSDHEGNGGHGDDNSDRDDDRYQQVDCFFGDVDKKFKDSDYYGFGSDTPRLLGGAVLDTTHASSGDDHHSGDDNQSGGDHQSGDDNQSNNDHQSGDDNHSNNNHHSKSNHQSGCRN